MKVVATIYTDFSEKFGIPRQGALAHESEGIIVFEPEYRMEEALRGIENILICGFCGSFQKMYRKNGRLLSDLRDWEEISE